MMKQFKQIIFAAACTMFAIASAVAQYNITFVVTDVSTGTPIQDASISLDGNFFGSTDASGQFTFSGFPNGTFPYSVNAPCYFNAQGTVTVSGADASVNVQMDGGVNNVFFFIGSPMAQVGVFVELFNNENYFTTTTSSPFGGDMIENVPFGTYTYVLTKPCFQSEIGQITVDCNGGDGVAVFTSLPEATTNNVFFFIGSPMAQVGVFVELFNNENYFTMTSSSPFGGDMIENVPFGTYTYILTKPCFESEIGQITVDCNEGNGVAVFTSLPAATTNNVFFFVGFPLTIPGATVTLTGDNYNESLTTGGILGDMFENVPYGTFTYTVSKPCYQTITGQVTVNCNNGDGIAVEANPTSEPVNTAVEQNENVLTAAASGYSYQWVDCNNANQPIEGATAQTYTATAIGSYAVILTGGNCEGTSACYPVTTLGVNSYYDASENLSVYPNPFSGTLNMKIEHISGRVDVRIYSVSGYMVHEVSYNTTGNIQLELSELSTGVYFIHTDSDAGPMVRKIVKQ